MPKENRELGPQSTHHEPTNEEPKVAASEMSRDGGMAKDVLTKDPEFQDEKISNTTDSEDQSGPESEPVQAIPDHVYLEGGVKAWLVVFGSWCAMFAALGIINTFAAFQAYISQHQLAAYSDGQIGWIFGVYAFLAFACGVYIGPIFDVYGPRWLILPGGACLILTMFLVGVCREYWHFMLAFGMIGGLGTALMFTPSIAVVGHYFNKGRGNATGIAATGGAMGGIVFPLLLQSLIPKIGWAWSTRIIGFLFIAVYTVAILLIRANLPPAHKATSPHPNFRILTQPAFAATVIGVFLIEWALFVPLTYITSYALREGFSTAFSYQILPILNAGSVFGRWLPGFYSDKIGRFNTALISIIFTLILIFGLWLPVGHTTPGLIVFAALFGLASGSNISLTPVCVGQLCETKDYGRYYATCYTIASVACLTGVPIAGEILQRCGGEYWGLICFTGACYVGALGAFVIARGLGGGWRFWMKY